MRNAVDAGERYLKEHAANERRVLLVITDGRETRAR